jgi:surfactin synthase thioesterase subunit
MPRDNRYLPFGNGGAGPRLYCLPYAGGGASVFVAWRRGLPGVAVAPVQYPGRETRIDEPCPDHLPRLVDDLAAALTPELETGQPYALLGYSLGAKVAFTLAHRLIALGLPAPQALHVVAHRAPDAPPPHPGAARLGAAEFREHLRSYGGTPDEVFDTPELAELVLPILRADFALSEQSIPLASLACPIIAYCGRNDAVADPQAMARWQSYSRTGFALRSFEGGHFFTRSATDFLPALALDVANWANLPPVNARNRESVILDRTDLC